MLQRKLAKRFIFAAITCCMTFYAWNISSGYLSRKTVTTTELFSPVSTELLSISKCFRFEDILKTHLLVDELKVCQYYLRRRYSDEIYFQNYADCHRKLGTLSVAKLDSLSYEPFKELILHQKFSSSGSYEMVKMNIHDNVTLVKFFKDGRKCFMVSPQPDDRKTVEATITEIVLNENLTVLERRTIDGYVTINGQLPYDRKVSDFKSDRYWLHQLALSVHTAKILPKPYATECVTYDDLGFRSQYHCIQECIFYRQGRNKSVSLLIRDSQASALEHSVEQPPSVEDAELCYEKCKFPDCETLSLHKTSKPDLGIITNYTERELYVYDNEGVLMNVSPKFSVLMLLIYIGDLLSLFYGFAMISMPTLLLSLARKLRRRKIRVFAKCLKRMFSARGQRLSTYAKHAFSLFCLLGCLYHSTTVISQYMRYKVSTETSVASPRFLSYPNIIINAGHLKSLKTYYRGDSTANVKKYSDFAMRSLPIIGLEMFSPDGQKETMTKKPLTEMFYKARRHLDMYFSIRVLLLSNGLKYDSTKLQVLKQVPLRILLNSSSEQVKIWASRYTLPSGGASGGVGSQKLNYKEFAMARLGHPYGKCFNYEQTNYENRQDCLTQCDTKLSIEQNSITLLVMFEVTNVTEDLTFNRSIVSDSDDFLSRQQSVKILCSKNCPIEECNFSKMGVSSTKVHSEDKEKQQIAVTLNFDEYMDCIESPKMTLFSCFLLCIGILGVWFGFSVPLAIDLLLMQPFADFWTDKNRSKNVFKRIASMTSLAMFLYQAVLLVQQYFSYDIASSAIIAIPTKIVPPSISSCLAESALEGNEGDVDLSFVHEGMSKHLEFSFLGANSYRMTKVSRALAKNITSRAFFKNKRFCLEWQFEEINKATADLTQIGKVAFFRIVFNDVSLDSAFYVHPKGKLPFAEEQIRISWNYTNLISWGMSSLSRNLLPAPYRTNCTGYEAHGFESQGHCFNECYKKLFAKRTHSLPMDAVYTDLARNNFLKAHMNDLSLSKAIKSSCSDLCIGEDCVQLKYKVIDEEPLLKHLDEYSRKYYNFSLPALNYRAEYFPAMTVPMFIIYLGSLVGLWFGLDASIMLKLSRLLSH